MFLGSDEMAVDTTGSQRSQESEIPDLGVRCPCGVNEVNYLATIISLIILSWDICLRWWNK